MKGAMGNGVGKKNSQTGDDDIKDSMPKTLMLKSQKIWDPV